MVKGCQHTYWYKTLGSSVGFLEIIVLLTSCLVSFKSFTPQRACAVSLEPHGLYTIGYDGTCIIRLWPATMMILTFLVTKRMKMMDLDEFHYHLHGSSLRIDNMRWG
ncbi:hypothetical protein IGI04_041170 [Brassica rapa subsp. trilocularis]|uniref:Uncharacterized protein n=1 Tax=Brassica rapa subsp. trilocularis TaxID=1813537 RepID=A0ABQ7KTD3_BRACM|nr:hypothetical protein IGI04_041170 [Brassica rapa subsp. trilocularis]